MLETTEEKYERVSDELIQHPNYGKEWIAYYRDNVDTFEGGIPDHPGSAIMKWSTLLMEKWLSENESSFFDKEREAELDELDELTEGEAWDFAHYVAEVW